MQVNDLLRGYMPKRNIQSYLWKNINCLNDELISKLNEMHRSSDGNHTYYIHFTQKYAMLKCTGRDYSKHECPFRYWFSFQESDSGEQIDFALFRLINSNHCYPLH